MTLNGVVAFILLYFTEFDSFAEYRLLLLAKTDQSHIVVSL